MIAWFARNSVAANLLMITIMAIGLYSVTNRIPLEVFPSFELDTVNITTALPAASPEDVEQSISVRIEEAIADLDGIEYITSRSSEGVSTVRAEIDDGYDSRNLLNDIKSRIDAVSTFPDDAERPVISLIETNREVISVVVYGNLQESELKRLAEDIRDNLLKYNNISRVIIEASRDYEIVIEVSEKTLKEYNLTLQAIGQKIAQGSVDLSAGNIRTPGGDVLVRTKGQAYNKSDFEEIVVITNEDGSVIKVKDIARVIDGFEEDKIITRFNGQPASVIEIYRIGDQSAIEVADRVRNYIDEVRNSLPDGVNIDTWRDRSKIVKSRLKTLTNSALQGGILVFLLLTLFLRPAVAVWVCIGIPLSFMGAFIIMPYLGVTLNVVSLFAFILVLGIVVDDAIVTGENIYRHLRSGEAGIDAAIVGTHEVAVPVTFGILTTVAAFVPIFFIEGMRGAIFAQIPAIVIPVLLFSLIESKLILPAHLKNVKPRTDQKNMFWLMRFQQNVSHGFENSIVRYYRPALNWALDNRGLTLTTAIAVAIVVFTIATSGWMRFVFFPRIESETIRINLTMPANTSFEITDRYINHIAKQSEILKQKYVDEGTGKSLISNILAISGSGGGGAEPHTGRLALEVVSPEDRHVEKSVSELVKELRQMVGPIPGAELLSYRAEIGRAGNPIDVQLTGGSLEVLEQLAEQIKTHLQGYPGVFEITDSLSGGKQELKLSLKPSAEPLGITLNELARQVRQAFYGYEIQRIQRGRNEVKVMIRFPEDNRRSINDLYKMTLTTPSGKLLPFSEVAEVIPDTSPTSIYRIDRFRIVNVTADVNKQTVDIEAVKRGIRSFTDELLLSHPGVSYSLEGEAKEQQETFGSLKWGLLGVLFIVYTLLAIPFKSYWQPLIVMSIIPLGLTGAIIGHWIMAKDLSLMSMLGMLALTGVVVNDSLVLVDYINKQLQKGHDLMEAVLNAGAARFRPVILTSLTTFAGLMPLLFEKSTQAQFLIPMAISLGFGILFATMVTLVLVPVNYVLASMLKDRVYRIFKPSSVGSVKS